MFGKRHSGFTLIEILIVLAILGILASIAIPSYGEYVKRAKIAEAVVLSEDARIALVLNHARTRVFVATNFSDLSARNLSIGLKNATDYKSGAVEKLWVGSGGVSGATSTSAHIAIMLDSDLGVGTTGSGTFARLLSTVEYKDGEYIYVCGNSDSIHGNHVKSEYLPESCRN